MRKRIVAIFIVVCMLLGSLLIFSAAARPQPRPVNIRMFTDIGWRSRYSSPVGASARISQVLLPPVSNMFQQSFNLNPRIESFVARGSPSDACPANPAPHLRPHEHQCGCGGGTCFNERPGWHHKNVVRVHESIPVSPIGVEQYLTMMFTGHITCDQLGMSSQTHRFFRAHGMINLADGTRRILVIDAVSDHTRDFEITHIIAHELVHAFGVVNHCRNPLTCIMGNEIPPVHVRRNLSMCSPCRNTVLSNWNRFPHS